MLSKLQIAIGAIKDQTSISLAKVNSTSSNLQVAVLKATTHDELPIDDRYIYEILNLISSDKNYASSCARAICRRITRTNNWIVALKSLMLVLRIFQDGDPYFPREILHASKSGGRQLNLSDFSDYSTSDPWDYTGFIRTFGLYLEERLECFLTGKLQTRYTGNKKDGFRRKNNDSVSNMKPSIFLDKIVYWQRLLQRAIAIRPTGITTDNQLVKISCYAVVKESFDLYRDISDGLAYLLDNVVSLPYQSRVSVLEICVNAKKMFEELEEFYIECRMHDVGESLEYPIVEQVSEEVIERLHELLKDQTASGTPEKEVGLLSKRNQSYGEESVFSGLSSTIERTSDKISESGSEYESSEEIMIVPEVAEHPIDLKTCSAESVSNSAVELSVNDWPASDEHKETQEKEDNQDSLEPALVNEVSNTSSSNTQSQPPSSKIWELVPAENVTPSSNTQSNSFSALRKPQSWHQTATLLNTFKASTAYTLHSRPQPQHQVTPISHDNPFLEDLYDIPANNSSIISYWSQNQAIDTDNPFTQVSNEQVTISRDEYNSLINQQYLLQQQLLMLNKMIARHTTIA